VYSFPALSDSFVGFDLRFDSPTSAEKTEPAKKPAVSPANTSSGNAARTDLALVHPSISRQYWANVPANQVAAGETLYQICEENYGRFDNEILAKIYALNPWLIHAEDLRPGQVLSFLPRRICHRVREPKRRGLPASRHKRRKTLSRNFELLKQRNDT